MAPSSRFPHPRRLLPSTKSLSTFEAVARLSSFTRAAAELSLSQSAVSKQISTLERQLGLPLFESKRNYRVALTPSGQQYFDSVSHILSDLSASTASIIASSDDMRTLRLGIPSTFGSRWLIPRIGKFLESEPDIEIEFATRMGARLQPNFGGLDASIEFAPEPDTEHVWQLLMPWTVMAVASKTLIQDYDLESPSDLDKVSVLLHRFDVSLWNAWTANSTSPDVSGKTIIFEAYPMVFQAAVVGLGAAFAPTALIQKELVSGELVKPFDIDIRSPHQCYLVHPKDRQRQKPLKLFRDWLIAEAEKP